MDFLEARIQYGRNLIHVRKERQFSVEALSILSGISQWDIIAIENGTSNINVQEIMKLAETLNVDLESILVEPTFERN